MTQKDCILIVDDDPVFTQAVSMLVEKLGYRPLVANGGMEGIAMMNQQASGIAAMLLDIFMPCIDGISVLGQVKSKHPEIPVIVISGSADVEEYKQASKSLGAVAYIEKPVNLDDLTDILKDALEQAL